MARLPFIQAAQDLFPRARMLARFLHIPEAQGVGLAVMLEAWAVEMAPEGDTSGQIVDEHPEEVVAAALGWDGDPSALYAALIRARFITKASGEPEAGFDFVPGLEKYAKALGLPTSRTESSRKAAKIMWERKKDASRIEKACEPRATESHDAKRGDAKTQTQTQTQTEATASQGTAGAVQQPGGRPSLTLTAQDANPQPKQRAPRKPSAAEELYQQVQAVRQAQCDKAGVPYTPDYMPEALQNKMLGPVAKVPPGAEVDAEGRTEALRRFGAAFAEYLGDDFHRAKGWPLALFLTGAVRARYEQAAALAAQSAMAEAS